MKKKGFIIYFLLELMHIHIDKNPPAAHNTNKDVDASTSR